MKHLFAVSLKRNMNSTKQTRGGDAGDRLYTAFSAPTDPKNNLSPDVAHVVWRSIPVCVRGICLLSHLRATVEAGLLSSGSRRPNTPQRCLAVADIRIIRIYRNISSKCLRRIPNIPDISRYIQIGLLSTFLHD